MSIPRLNRGDLRHRIKVQSLTETLNDFGDPVQSWTDAFVRYARIRYVKGTETHVGRGLNAETTHLVSMDFVSGLTAKHRIVHGSRNFDIISINNIEELDVTLEIEAKEQDI